MANRQNHGGPLIGKFVLFALIFLSMVTVRTAAAQVPGDQNSPNEAGSSVTKDQPAADDDERYRIGPGDVLDIRIFNRPQLSRDAVRVDGRGMIRMPLIEDEILAACRTESELAKEIATRYLKYQRNPQVDVFLKEFQSQPVAVIGAVNAPGRFQLQRRVRLLELLTFAGGPADSAGRSIQIVHAPARFACEGNAARAEDDTSLAVYYELSQTLQGQDQANPYVKPGDVIAIPAADMAYVVGNVLKPSAIPLKEPITISRAIAMTGGLMPDTKSDQIRIIRQLKGSTTKTEIVVNLKAIEKRQAEDVALLANDIVNVPTSGGKRFLRSIISGIAPAVSQMPVRVVP